jgi:hypothetical protein
MWRIASGIVDDDLTVTSKGTPLRDAKQAAVYLNGSLLDRGHESAPSSLHICPRGPLWIQDYLSQLSLTGTSPAPPCSATLYPYQQEPVMGASNSEISASHHIYGSIPYRAQSQEGFVGTAGYHDQASQSGASATIAPGLLSVSRDKRIPNIIITDSTVQQATEWGDRTGSYLTRHNGNSHPNSMASILHPPSHDHTNHLERRPFVAKYPPVGQKPSGITKSRNQRIPTPYIRAVIESKVRRRGTVRSRRVYDIHVGALCSVMLLD